MKINRHVMAVLAAGALVSPAYAIPAKQGLITYDNDGDPIEVFIRGDERFHYYVSEDGYPLQLCENGEFRYYIADGKGGIKLSDIKALGVSKRDDSTRRMLAQTDRAGILEELKATAIGKALREKRSLPKRRVSDESYLNTFPTIGTPRVLAILVEYQDVKFTVENPRQLFNAMLNEEGFSQYGATGSIADYFKASSNGQFRPQFDVYGPVTLPQNMSYYGGNANGNDIRPYEMVPQACGLLDGQIDFTQYDTDGDGVIDNVYIFYAGYGEADGGPESSVWPHSWNLNDDLGFEYYFDGKLLNHYATSNELSNGHGSNLAGIGVFCHEFSHVMGLPDLYSTVYTSAFTPGNWSVMDHGSYNNDCHTPPLHTAYERYCLNWIEPKLLSEPTNVSMYPVSQIGNYDDAYMIRTERREEYYILENRQQRGWDEYIPGHGMLVWHIDFVPDLWNLNIVNIEKQYIDIVEADNDPSPYTIEGDAFPGTANVTEFTDDTRPSMKSWAGNPLHSPITEIKEINGVISFMFKGGTDIFDPVKAENPADVKPGSFVAKWQKVSKASGYLLSVYTKDAKGNKKYEPGLMRMEVGDTDSKLIDGLVPATEYFYVVQATNGRFYSSDSNEVAVVTSDPTLDYLTVTALPATEIGANGFTANWERLDDADNYTVCVYTRQLGEPFQVVTGFDSSQVPDGWKILACTYDSREPYSMTPPSLRMTSHGASLTTSNYKDGIRTLSFWMRSNTEPNGNSLVIETLQGGEWTELTQITKISEDWKLYDIADIPAGCVAVRISYNRPETGNIYIDDLTLGYGGEYKLLPISGMTALDGGNADSLAINGLQAESDYSYSVTAHNGQFDSKESELIPVRTLKESGVTAISPDENIPVEIFTLQGIKVEKPRAGEIYIFRQGSHSRKAVAK